MLVAAFALGCSSGGSDAPASPTGLTVVAGSSAHAANGALLSPAPAIQLTDASGAAVARAGVQVTVVLGELHGTLSGTAVQVTDNAGKARFPDLRVVGPVGTYHLAFSSSGLNGARSALDLAAGSPALIRAVTLQQQYGPVGSGVRELPGALVTDATNNPVTGAHVIFSLVQGTGMIARDAVTGRDGQAVAASWVLGAVGDHVVEARVEGLESTPVAFSATALPAMGMVRMVQQPPGSARIGEVLVPPPAVQLFDAYGYPSRVAGVSVTAGIGGSSGSVIGSLIATTDATGKATFPALAFAGAVEGPRTLVFSSTQRASVESAPVDVGVAAGGASAYSITLRFLTGATAEQTGAFEAARSRIAEVITGDVPDLFVGFAAMPECGNTPISEIVDDLVIWVDLSPIDGYGGILGQAGPCIIRSSSKLPAVGIMMFDTADLQWLEDAGQLDVVILHEMLHVVGFGVIWRDLGLATGLGTTNPYFTGPGARAAYLYFDGGSSYAGIPVPVENAGGAGTRDAHWREAALGNELMTGWLTPGVQPLSRTSIASLGDMGYIVDLARAEPLSASSALRSGEPGGGVDVGADVLRIPLREVPEL